MADELFYPDQSDVNFDDKFMYKDRVYTIAKWGYIRPPSIHSPVIGEFLYNNKLYIHTSDFNTYDCWYPWHVATIYRITEDYKGVKELWSKTIEVSIEERENKEKVSLLNQYTAILPEGMLIDKKEYYLWVKYKDINIGWSDWSKPRRFTYLEESIERNVCKPIISGEAVVYEGQKYTYNITSTPPRNNTKVSKYRIAYKQKEQTVNTSNGKTSYNVSITSDDRDKVRLIAVQAIDNTGKESFFTYQELFVTPRSHDRLLRVTQGSFVTLFKEHLKLSGLPNYEYDSIIETTNGTIKEYTSYITFTPNVRYGNEIKFIYKLVNKNDSSLYYRVICYMFLDSLPPVQVHVFKQPYEMYLYMSNYEHPTIYSIFRKFGRVGDCTNYFPYDEFPSGEADSWKIPEYSHEVDIICKQSTINPTGLVSNYVTETYSLQVDITSDDTKSNGHAGIIIAYYEHWLAPDFYLIAYRRAYKNEFGIYMYYGHTQTKILSVVDNSDTTVDGNRFADRGVTRVQVVRNGDVITCKCSDFGSTSFDETKTITLDLSDPKNAFYKQLSWARLPSRYGISCLSQKAKFSNIKLDDNIVDDIFIYENYDYYDVYKYNTSKKQWDYTTASIPSLFNYPRLLIDRVSQRDFEIRHDTMYELSGYD